jgi:hypothetical protein
VLTVGVGWRTGEDGGARVTRGDGPRAADTRDQGEAGPGVSGGVQERAKRRGRVPTCGPRQHSARRARFKPDLKRNPTSNASNKFQTVSNKFLYRNFLIFRMDFE